MLLRSDKERLEALQQYILDHLNSDLNIKALSKMFGWSSSTLRRQFQCYFQVTIYQYIYCKRMERARDLILECNYTINEISEEVGYSEPSNFSHAFIKHFGIAPSRFNK